MRSIGFILREFLESLRQNKFLHFTYGAQVTISLLVLGVFFVLLVTAAFWWHQFGAAMEVHVYLQDKLAPSQYVALEAQLNATPHVETVRYRSKEEALEVFQKRHPSIRLSDLLETNPLPDSYILGIDKPEHITGVVERVNNLEGVLNVLYPEQILLKYKNVLVILVSICVVTIALLLIFAFSSINNIINLSVYARRTEIRIMQLVGATWWFIRWPFILEGVFFGIIGALVAQLIIWLMLTAVGEAMRVTQLSMVIPGLKLSDTQVLIGLFAILVGLGIVIGFSGSLRAVTSYLHKEAAVHIGALKLKQMLR